MVREAVINVGHYTYTVQSKSCYSYLGNWDVNKISLSSFDLHFTAFTFRVGEQIHKSTLS